MVRLCVLFLFMEMVVLNLVVLGVVEVEMFCLLYRMVMFFVLMLVLFIVLFVFL